MAPPPKSGSPELLAALRAAMAAQGLAALVVPSEGAFGCMFCWVGCWVWGVDGNNNGTAAKQERVSFSSTYLRAQHKRTNTLKPNRRAPV